MLTTLPGLRALGNLVQKMDGSPKVGIIAGVGDRRDEDTIELGAVAAEIFDEVIIPSRPKLEREI